MTAGAAVTEHVDSTVEAVGETLRSTLAGCVGRSGAEQNDERMASTTPNDFAFHTASAFPDDDINSSDDRGSATAAIFATPMNFGTGGTDLVGTPKSTYLEGASQRGSFDLENKATSDVVATIAGTDCNETVRKKTDALDSSQADNEGLHESKQFQRDSDGDVDMNGASVTGKSSATGEQGDAFPPSKVPNSIFTSDSNLVVISKVASPQKASYNHSLFCGGGSTSSSLFVSSNEIMAPAFAARGLEFNLLPSPPTNSRNAPSTGLDLSSAKLETPSFDSMGKEIEALERKTDDMDVGESHVGNAHENARDYPMESSSTSNLESGRTDSVGAQEVHAVPSAELASNLEVQRADVVAVPDGDEHTTKNATTGEQQEQSSNMQVDGQTKENLIGEENQVRIEGAPPNNSRAMKKSTQNAAVASKASESVSSSARSSAPSPGAKMSSTKKKPGSSELTTSMKRQLPSVKTQTVMKTVMKVSQKKESSPRNAKASRDSPAGTSGGATGKSTGKSEKSVSANNSVKSAVMKSMKQQKSTDSTAGASDAVVCGTKGRQKTTLEARDVLLIEETPSSKKIAAESPQKKKLAMKSRATPKAQNTPAKQSPEKSEATSSVKSNAKAKAKASSPAARTPSAMKKTLAKQAGKASGAKPAAKKTSTKVVQKTDAKKKK